jgi:hypothetical protein
MTGASLSEVETSLAIAVRIYLLAEPNDRISEDENLRPVCSWLARWIHSLLKNSDGWGPYRSVDYILPCSADRSSPANLVFRGLLVWMDDRTREWKEPLYAKIHLSGNPSTPLEYEVHVGDAEQGLGKVPYGTLSDYPSVPVDRWLFTFIAPDAGV